MQIMKLEPGQLNEFKNLLEIFKEVFNNTESLPPDTYLQKLLANKDFMTFVVNKDNTVLGGLTIYVLHRYYGVKPIAYIYDVAISPAYQGRGLGKTLIAEVCSYCKANGFEDAYVEAESDDIDAVNFYRKTNFSQELNATHFTYTFNDENE